MSAADFSFDHPIPLDILRRRAHNHRWATVQPEVIPLTAADPDFPVAPVVQQALTRYVSDGVFSYGPPLGLPEFREAVAAYHREHKGVDVQAEQVIAVDSAARGMSVVCRALLRPGDEAIILDPVDFLFPRTAESAGATIRRLGFDWERRRFPVQELSALITPHTRLIYLCHPHNPLGLLFTRHELRQLVDLAELHDLRIVCDEIWSDIVYPGQRFHSILSIAGAATRCVTLTGFSKNFGLAGLRVGAVVAPDERLHELIVKATEATDTIGGTSTLSQVAATAALVDGWPWFTGFLSHLHTMRNLVVDGLNAIPGVRAHSPQATYVVLADVSAYGERVEDICARLIDRAGVALVPGSTAFFGPGAEGHLRLSFATHRDVLTEALARLTATFEDFAEHGLSGGGTVLNSRRAVGLHELTDLKAQVTGPVLLPGDGRYAEETATWNLALTHRPAVVVGATGASDVQVAVRFAGQRKLPVAVVATGHGAVVPADGALLINLRRMDGVTIDPRAGTATVGAATEMQTLVDAAAEHDLAPLAGSSPNVGVVGFTLGGGLSPVLGRAHGYAADHVVGAEIVTPDGELRRIDAETEPDLFWAVRGGKGNFGVVTSLTVRLVPVTRIYGGGLYFLSRHAGAVLNAFREAVGDAPEELSLSLAFLRLPAVPSVPEQLQSRFTVHVRVAFLGPAAEGERLIAGLRAAAPTLIDSVAEMPFTAMASIHDDPVDPVPEYEISTLLHSFPREAADALLAAAGPRVDSPALLVEIRQLGGALSRDPKTPNAVGNRDAQFQFFAAVVADPGMTKNFRGALAGLVRALDPWSMGRKQANFLSEYDTAEAVEKAYEPAAFERLLQIKEAWDPHNLFRINHNVRARS
ncbi:aminotransferase class I/II-fold pyridoxal phosphate-dependent enzyme [Streptomyces sp. NPDC004096]